MQQEGLFVYVSLVALSLIKTGFCQTGDDAKALRTKLFVSNSYDKRILPLNNQSTTIDVHVNLYLLSINELNEGTEVLKSTGYLWLLWHDDFLVWDPSHYGGIKYYLWPQKDVWKPDIALKNSNREYKELGVDSLNVLVWNDGWVEWKPIQVFESTCEIDITYFPFDVHECELEFVAWSYTKSEILIQSGEKGINTESFETNSEWDVLDTNYTIRWESDEASIVSRIKMKRKPLYVLLIAILPVIMLAILNTSAFLLPFDCGEKASYVITVYLAFTVYLSVMESTFPENSETVAVFSIYLIILTIESTIITVLVLILIRISRYDDEQKPVPKCLQAMMRLCRFNTRHIKNNPVANKQIPNEESTCEDGEGSKDLDDSSNSVSDYTWRQAIHMMDFTCFIFFGLLFLMSTLAFFIITITGNR